MITQALISVLVTLVLSQDTSMFTYNQLASEFGNTMIVQRPILTQKEINKLKSLMKLLSDENSDNPTAYCQRFRTCFECTKTVWYNCGWCHDLGCTEHPELICPNSMNYLQSMGKKECSYLIHNGPMFIPAYVQKTLNLSVYVSDPVLYTKEIICQIKMRTKQIHVKGKLEQNTIICQPIVLEIENPGEAETGAINVIWGGMEPYSNQIPITVYHCESFADNCESCRTVPLEYECGWCDDVQQCVISDKCSSFRLWNLNKLTCEAEKKKLYYV